jgi:hypothetical protein
MLVNTTHEYPPAAVGSNVGSTDEFWSEGSEVAANRTALPPPTGAM